MLKCLYSQQEWMETSLDKNIKISYWSKHKQHEGRLKNIQNEIKLYAYKYMLTSQWGIRSAVISNKMEIIQECNSVLSKTDISWRKMRHTLLPAHEHQSTMPPSKNKDVETWHAAHPMKSLGVMILP